MKEYPNKEDNPGKGIVISTYWNEGEWSILRTFMEQREIANAGSAIKQGFFLGANIMEKLLGPLFEIKMKRKIRSDKGIAKKKSES